MCKRRLSNLLRAATNTKSKFNKDILSIDYDYENYDTTLIDIISDDNKNNPLINIATRENLEAIINSCEAKLSPFETKVFDLMILEYDYKQIADVLHESPKKSIIRPNGLEERLKMSLMFFKWIVNKF